jgi:hypothetical protein
LRWLSLSIDRKMIALVRCLRCAVAVRVPPYQLEEGTHEIHDSHDTGCGDACRVGVLRRSAQAGAATAATAAASDRSARTAAAADGRSDAAAAADDGSGSETARCGPALPAGNALFASGAPLRRQ